MPIYFFMLQWRRLRATYSERSLARHEQRLIEALDIRYRMARDLANWEI